jgi:hypothetical protein
MQSFWKPEQEFPPRRAVGDQVMEAGGTDGYVADET